MCGASQRCWRLSAFRVQEALNRKGRCSSVSLAPVRAAPPFLVLAAVWIGCAKPGVLPGPLNLPK